MSRKWQGVLWSGLVIEELDCEVENRGGQISGRE